MKKQKPLTLFLTVCWYLFSSLQEKVQNYLHFIFGLETFFDQNPSKIGHISLKIIDFSWKMHVFQLRYLRNQEELEDKLGI